MATEILPFERGSSLYNGLTVDTADDYGKSKGMEGQEFYLTSKSPSTSMVRTSQNDVKVRIVRNTSGGALAPGRPVTYEAGEWGRRVDAYTGADGEYVAGVVDDHLPAAGVANGDLFYIIVEGPCYVKSPALAAQFHTDGTSGWAAGDVLMSGSSGYLKAWDGTATAGETEDGTISTNILNVCGRAAVAQATGNTTTDTLVYISRIV